MDVALTSIMDAKVGAFGALADRRAHPRNILVAIRDHRGQQVEMNTGSAGGSVGGTLMRPRGSGSVSETIKCAAGCPSYASCSLDAGLWANVALCTQEELLHR